MLFTNQLQDDLSRGAWRALYSLTNSAGPRGAAAVSRALGTEDIVSLIIDAMPKPDPPSYTATESLESKMARQDLYHFASASVQFFHLGMEHVWQSLYSLAPLLRILEVEPPASTAGRMMEKAAEFRELGCVLISLLATY